MNCIIVEDQPPAQRILQKYIQDLGDLTLQATFSDVLQTIEFLNTTSVDLIFLDIHLPKVSGIDFLKITPNPPLIILTTAFPNYALESYEFDVVDYLLKPFSFQRFAKAVQKAQERFAPATTPTTIFIKSGYDHIKITVDEILYLHSDSDYVELHLSHKKFLSPKPLHYWENRLMPQNFVRVHKSYVVNWAHVAKITRNRLFLNDKQAVPIGRAYKESVNRHLKR